MTMSPRSVRFQQRVLEHRGRLDGRMVLEATAGVGAERGGAGIGPDVRAPAPAFAELDVVDVRGGTVLEHRQQLVLGPVEAAHAGVGLRPDYQIEGFFGKCLTRLVRLD
jgi:hypothetical protein